MDQEVIKKLIQEAKKIAKQNFCCKHSNFTVGAALLTEDDKIITGFNVENDGIQSICAERVTFSKAFTEGYKNFKCIAIVGKKTESAQFQKTLPCGYCRQFMSEYVDKNFKIYTIDDKENKIYGYTISQLLPESFKF